jgi:hypothetical protein
MHPPIIGRENRTECTSNELSRRLIDDSEEQMMFLGEFDRQFDFNLIHKHRPAPSTLIIPLFSYPSPYRFSLGVTEVTPVVVKSF